MKPHKEIKGLSSKDVGLIGVIVQSACSGASWSCWVGFVLSLNMFKYILAGYFYKLKINYVSRRFFSAKMHVILVYLTSLLISEYKNFFGYYIKWLKIEFIDYKIQFARNLTFSGSIRKESDK